MCRWYIASLALLAMALTFPITCSSSPGRPRIDRGEQSRHIHPQTVADYFLLLPNRYIGEAETQGDRRDMLSASGAICDVKHDYLLSQGDGAQPMLSVVLFRHGKKVTVAVLNGGYDPPKPTLDFLRYDGKHWTNVTKQILPSDAVPEPNDYDRLTYQLPRYGTTIHVLNSVGTKEFDLVWHGGRFIQQPAR
jgi:hypothetical protein